MLAQLHAGVQDLGVRHPHRLPPRIDMCPILLRRHGGRYRGKCQNANESAGTHHERGGCCSFALYAAGVVKK